MKTVPSARDARPVLPGPDARSTAPGRNQVQRASSSPQPPGARALGATDVLRQFRVIFRSVTKHFQVIERECGVGGSQLWALATIVENPGIRVTDLARSLSIHQSTTSNLVEQLVRLGLAVRERDGADQRVVRLRATARAGALIARAPQPLVGLLPDALSRLAPADLERLHAALAGLLRQMRVRDETAADTPLSDM